MCPCSGSVVLRCLYLDGSGQVGFLLAEVEQTGNGYSIRQVVDKGHVVDKVVCLSKTQYDYGGNTLWKMRAVLEMKLIIN